ncbi:MAG: radical SAM protein [Muribaculaceae bacterium]|nr:radical SAM protein [Muribaculaceae bacterium]
MQTVLFHNTIFGPIHSRRLGISLGVNLMPNDGKVCSFDCLYCEAGFNAQGPGKDGIPSRESVKRQLKNKLETMKAAGDGLDVITFSGNGEPTLHPHFAEVVHDVIMLRDRYYPNAKVSVLSNSTMAGRPQVAEALKKVDNNILKLDSAIAGTLRIINRPQSPNVIPEGVIEDLKQFSGQCIVQTMMLRGEWEGKTFDNTTPDEVDALIEAYKQIQPREVMLYSIDRKTPAESLQKVEIDELRAIGQRIQDAIGIPVQVN